MSPDDSEPDQIELVFDWIGQAQVKGVGGCVEPTFYGLNFPIGGLRLIEIDNVTSTIN